MDSKERLLHEALGLFALRGVDSVGVQEIVDAAGVTKPTLYHHFSSKDGLVNAVVCRGFARLFSTLDALGVYDGDLPRYLERQAATWIECVRSHQDWFRLELSLWFLPPANPSRQWVRPGIQELVERLEGLFEAASQQHGNLRGRRQRLASGWLGSLHHWTAIVLDGWGDQDEFFLQGTRQFLYGIFS